MSPMGEIGLLPLFKLRLHGEPARKALEVRCVWIEALEGQRAEWGQRKNRREAGGFTIVAPICAPPVDVRASRAGNPISTEYRIGRVLNIESRARSMAGRREAGQGSTGREGAFVFVVGVLILRWAANSAESPAARLTRGSSTSADPIPAGSESDAPSTAQSRDCSRLAKPKAQQVFAGLTTSPTRKASDCPHTTIWLPTKVVNGPVLFSHHASRSS